MAMATHNWQPRSIDEIRKIRKENTSTYIIRGATQFFITAEHVFLIGTPFYTELESRILLLHDGRAGHTLMTKDVLSGPYDLLRDFCMPLMQKLSPGVSLHNLAVEDVVRAKTYRLDIVPGDDGQGVQIAGADTYYYSPSFHIMPLALSDLPPSCGTTPFIEAADVFFTPSKERADTTVTHGAYMLPQGPVLLCDGTTRYFKHRRGPGFVREIDILGRLQQLTRHNLGTARMTELVRSEDTVVGLLVEMISPGYTLMSKQAWERPELCEKWHYQVQETVQILHSEGIVWGDVNPRNVIIDDLENAWIVDFAGGNAPVFVDYENMDTVQGDQQGIARLFKEWLPSRRKDVHDEDFF